MHVGVVRFFCSKEHQDMQPSKKWWDQNASWFIGLMALAAIAAIISTLISAGFIHTIPPSAGTSDVNGATNDHQATFTQIHQRSPMIRDALSQDLQHWMVGPGARGGTCTFERGSLHARQGVSGNVTQCISQDIHFTNYAIEVSEDLGDSFGGGIAFRVGSASYRFDVTQEGTADFVSDSGPPDYETPTLLFTKVNGGAHIGPGQTIAMFAVVRGEQFDFWVDSEYVGNVTVLNPPPRTGDEVGLFTFDQGGPTDVAFQGLSVWDL
jgi:hypothetical protein